MTSDATAFRSTTPDARAVMPVPMRVASWLLRVAVLGHAIALFAIVFHLRQTRSGNPLSGEVFDGGGPTAAPR